MRADAWFLYAGARSGTSQSSGLVRETFEVDPPGQNEVIAEPLFGSWEGNMRHALARSPIDVCRFRREERVVLGNAGVVRVLECGRDVTSLKPGQFAVLFGGCEPDAHDYPQKMLAYDAAQTMGCLATRIKLNERNLIVLPNATIDSLPRWAAFSVRYITAWSNLALALKLYRLMVPDSKDPSPNVWGWGGGTALAELELARRFGCRAVMLSGNARRQETIRRSGVTPLDRSTFGDLTFDHARAISDVDYRRAYTRAETQFLRAVDELTEGRRVQVFVDNIGTPVFRSTMRALSREGIITTAGWKEGMELTYLRAATCVDRQQFIHTHYARFDEAEDAVRYAERNDWLPQIDGPIYSFDDVPALARDFDAGTVGMFPIYEVNKVA